MFNTIKNTELDGTLYVEFIIQNINNLDDLELPDYVINRINENSTIKDFITMYETNQPHSRQLLQHELRRVCK